MAIAITRMYAHTHASRAHARTHEPRHNLPTFATHVPHGPLMYLSKASHRLIGLRAPRAGGAGYIRGASGLSVVSTIYISSIRTSPLAGVPRRHTAP